MKINKNLIILSLLLIFCISLGAVSAADNADISVNDMFDDSNNQVNIGFTKDTSISAVEIKGSNTVSNNGYAQTDELENNTSTDSNNNPSQPDNVLLISDSFNGANIMSLGVSSSIVYISTTGNDTTGDGSFANPVASLERALDIVPTNGQIIFKNGTYYPNNVAINKNVTITGMGEVILSGNSTNRILNIAKGTVTISNLIFKDGNVTFDDGGAIYVDSSASLIISDNNTFINNRASYDGGAIYSRGSLVVSGFNISFVNCSAGGYGGAIESSGSVVINSNNLIFINNTAGTYGGAIYFISGSGFVNYCIFDNNTAKSGSAIYINGGSVNVDYNFFGFQNNVTKFPSDLIYGAPPIKWVVLDIVKSGGEYVVKFVDNDGYDLDDFMPDYVVSLTINDEDAKEITIKNNTFKDNLVIGFYKLNSINTGNLLAETNFEIPNDSFTALNELIINSKDNTIVLDHDYKFYDDFDGDFIDGIVIDKNITIDGNNHTINGLNLARVFSVTANNVTIKNLTFVNCSANDDYGGAIYWYGACGSVESCSFVNCTAVEGGAIHIRDECNVSVVGCSFVNCTAVEGGAIYFGASVGLVSNCSFVNCTAVEGGAIYFGGSGSVGNVSGCSFVNCSAEEYGGAIHVFSEGSGSVVGCSFVNCTASKWGGAISFVGYGSVVGCSFMNCNTTFVGGAIYCAEGGVANCSFIGCSAIDSSSDDTIGGAILISNGSVVGCSFVGCSASNGGAIGIYNGSVNYCIFDNNNNAVNGRNIAIMDVDLPYSVNIDYNFFTFQNNLTTFPDNLIVIIKNKEVTSIYPNNWVVLDIVKSGGNYLVKFVLNDCSDLNNVMYDYNASLTINGENPYEITIKDNTFKGQFIEGSYLLTSSNSDIVLVNTTLNLTVPIYEIDVWDCEYGETAIINIIFKEEGVTGEIIVKISDNYIITRTINDKNRVSIPINGLSPGNHVLNISYSGNGAYLPFNTSATVIVSGSSEFDMNISVNDTLYGEVTYVVVNLPDDAIGYVELYINDKYYGDSGVRSGVATFNLSDLNPGTYDIDVVYNGTYGVAKNSTSFNVTAKTVNITLSSVTEFTVLSGENYTVTFTSDGEAIDGAKVIFELVNGDIKKNYTVYTDSEGKASLPINLAYTKEYIFNIYFNNTGYEYNVTSQTITVTVGNATFKDNFTDKTFNSTTMSGDNFTILLVDEKDKGIAGVYVDLDFKKGQNGTIVTYKIKTDSNGNVRLPLNLKYAGDYYLTAKYDTVESAEYTINIIPKPTNLTNTYEGKFVTTKNFNKEFVVKLTSEGLGVEGAIITFKLINKNNTPTTYHEVTDKNGEAKLAINISFVGNYTMKIIFEGNNIYAPSNESITSVEIKDA